MKAIKKINNNVAICLDSGGHQLVAFGKGIGYPAMPYTIPDLSVIQRTYYDVDEKFLPMLADIPEEVLDIARLVAERAQNALDTELNPNLMFTMADHIGFCLTRRKKGMRVKLPELYDIALTYPCETELARYALGLIRDRLSISLPESELSGIALNIINAEMESSPFGSSYNEAELTSQIIEIVDESFGISVDREDYNYARFATHLRYLYMRLNSNTPIKANHEDLYLPLKSEYPKTNECVEKVAAFLQAIWKIPIDNNERLYLWLHIDRLLTREEHGGK